jgi:hypothetical protein
LPGDHSGVANVASYPVACEIDRPHQIVQTDEAGQTPAGLASMSSTHFSGLMKIQSVIPTSGIKM